MTATALLETGPRPFKFQEFELSKLKEGEANIPVESNGVRATGINAYEGILVSRTFTRINGHEIVGVLEYLGPGA